MAVNTPNAVYSENLPVWQMMDDVCGTERDVKAKTTQYLPLVCACEDAKLNELMYEAYLKRAVFYPITADTLQSNIGLAFAEDPDFVADGMDFLEKDADGAGMSLWQLAQVGLGYQLQYGRGGFLVDHPPVTGGVSKTDVLKKGIRPTVTLYNPKNILNWRTRFINGSHLISLLVLQETSFEVDPMDEFKEIEVKTYRVLRLDEQDEYTVQLYTQRGSEEIKEGELLKPTNKNGSRWKYIPFQPIGAKANDFHIDAIPLEPIASINLAHYRNSAEYEQNLFYSNQAQPVISGLSPVDLQRLQGGGVKLGAATPILLSGNGAFQYVQTQTSGVAKEGMQDKLTYMQLLGAKLTESNEVAKTATQSDNEQMTKHSVLSLCVANMNEAMENVLNWCAEYYGSGYNAKFTIKQDFAKGKISLEELKQYQTMVAAQLMSQETFWNIVRTGKKPINEFSDEMLLIEKQTDGTSNQEQLE